MSRSSKRVAPTADDLVVVYEVVDRRDGTKGIGNSYEVSKAEAIAGIRADTLKAQGYARGVVPDEWVNPKGGAAADGEAKEVDGGSDITRAG